MPVAATAFAACRELAAYLWACVVQIDVYELRAKTASGIVPANTFTPASTLVGPIGLGRSRGPQQMLQFFRPYDSTFPQGASLVSQSLSSWSGQPAFSIAHLS